MEDKSLELKVTRILKNIFVRQQEFDLAAKFRDHEGDLLKSLSEKPIKPYFCKFLPVEGEIKEAERIYWKGKVYTHVPILSNFRDKTFGIIEGEKQGTHIPWDEGKPIKLFLCSRDIKVGDTIHDEDGGVYELNNSSYLEGYKNRNCTHMFKVIGEISPEAGWVKEGDEFDKDQIKLWTYAGEVRRPHPSMFDNWDGARIVVEILGPCGHFH